jgi:hypothetical protein
LPCRGRILILEDDEENVRDAREEMRSRRDVAAQRLRIRGDRDEKQ